VEQFNTPHIIFLAERYVRVMHRLFVCDVVAPYVQTCTFRQYFCTSNRLGTGQFVLKFWGKNRIGSRGLGDRAS